MEAQVVAENLTKIFGEKKAVDQLNLTVNKGEIFGLVGPDGAGKTTTLRMLVSILEPSHGNAWVCGHHTVKDAERIKEKIGYMSQTFGLYQDLSVAENLQFYSDIYCVPKKKQKQRMEELLDATGLAPFKKRLAGRLSGGMKQKLALCCALVHKPEVLFLDEPTNGVDPVSRRDFWRILYTLLSEGVTIIFSTAYLDEAERCSHIALLHEGKLLAEGTPQEVKGLFKKSILEVTTSSSRNAVEILRKEGFENLSIFGEKVHIFTESPKQAAAKAREILQASGEEIVSVKAIEPSLEDVFLSVLTEKGDSSHG